MIQSATKRIYLGVSTYTVLVLVSADQDPFSNLALVVTTNVPMCVPSAFVKTEGVADRVESLSVTHPGNQPHPYTLGMYT